MPKTPRDMIDTITRQMKDKTGKSVDEWRTALAQQKLTEPKAQAAWLRRQGLGHVQSKVAAGILGPYAPPAELVDAQYAGKKAGLRPIYDAVLAAARRLGKDVRPEPCGTYVPLHRNKTFAVIKPTTNTRVDLGLALGRVKPSGRLEAAKGVGSDRITHKIALSSKTDVDAEVARWLAAAYQLSYS